MKTINLKPSIVLALSLTFVAGLLATSYFFESSITGKEVTFVALYISFYAGLAFTLREANIEKLQAQLAEEDERYMSYIHLEAQKRLEKIAQDTFKDSIISK